MAHASGVRHGEHTRRSGGLIVPLGDVKTGRRIDQIPPYPCQPTLYEPAVREARQYVKLAESAHGDMPRSVAFDYIWGDGLEILARMAPDLRLINLETSVARADEPWPDKGIQYRSSGRQPGLIMPVLGLDSRDPDEMHARIMMDKGNLRGGNSGSRYCGLKTS